ncbi:MAG: hypothetical protein JNK82_31420 [Myxococcaceae bacterium]|nr:hypothetical protein [Myxococcaceae bacterium]
MKRVIIGSFGAGLLLSGLYLGTQSISNMRVTCEDVGQAECAFNAATAHELGRTQALGATGCALVGAGTLLFLRSQTSTKKEAA